MSGRLVVAVALAGSLLGCSGRSEPPPTRYDAGPPPRRVIGAPPRHVRALPPHAISAEGVGPYKLGVPMGQILSNLPSGPRMALLQIPGVLDYNVVRDEGIVVGGERQGTAQFIAVVRPEIARTAEDGVGVGASAAALAAALGPPLVEPRVVRDPALWVGSKLPGARWVLDGGRVSGVLLTRREARAPEAASPPATPPAGPGDGGAAPAPAPAPRCERAATDADFGGIGASVRFVPACLGGGDAMGTSGDLVMVATRASKSGPARRVSAVEIPGLVWAAPIEVDRGRDEIVVVAERTGEDGRAVSVIALRLEGTRLVRVADDVVYRLDETRATWIGASLSDLALHLEVTLDGDLLRVGGVLVHGRGTVRELAPLLPVTLRRRPRGESDRPRPDGMMAAPPADAGTDTNAPAVDAVHPDGTTSSAGHEPP